MDLVDIDQFKVKSAIKELELMYPKEEAERQEQSKNLNSVPLFTSGPEEASQNKKGSYLKNKFQNIKRESKKEEWPKSKKKWC